MAQWSESARGFSGDIEDFPLTSIMQILELGRKSGFLYVHDYPKIAFLVFKSGGIIQAISSLRREGLGELLMASGFIDKGDLQHALEVQRRAPKRMMLGEVLESLGHVQHEDVIGVLTRQMRDVVRWVLEWKKGEFTYYAGTNVKPNLTPEEQEMILPVGIVVEEVLKEMIPGSDRRVFPRAPVSIKVVRTDIQPSKSYFTQNVSGGGLLLLSEELLELGTSLSLQLWIPGMIEPSPCACKVVRHVPPNQNEQGGFAVQFLQIDPEAKKVLERLGEAFGMFLD